MSDSDEDLSNIFDTDENVEYLNPEDKLKKEDVKEIEVFKYLEEPGEEFDYAKRNLKEIMKIGLESIKDLHQLNKDYLKPSGFDALSNLMNTLVNTNDTLANIVGKEQKHKIAIHDPKINATQNNITNNNVFVGSTKDLMNIIKNAKSETIDNIST
jgi:hypothetical protein